MLKRQWGNISSVVLAVTLLTALLPASGGVGAISAATAPVLNGGAVHQPAVVAPLDPVAVRAAALAAGLGSLPNVPVPQVNNLADFYNDGPGARSAAVVLGKALFWDQQVGSDGQACASCHFAAGADNRSKNQLNPGFNSTPPDSVFGNGAITGVGTFPQFAPNYTVAATDFSFHQLAEPLREDYNHRVITRDSNDVISSQGVFKQTFTGIVPGQLNDAGTAVADPVFNVGGVNVRRVPPRQAPSVINAVFNFDNFWDGRAQNQFNGVNPFGPLDPTATILVNQAGVLSPLQVNIPNSSLASQAVGPVLNDIEMSYAGRTFPDVAKKLLATQPLKFQKVSLTDSVLGQYSRAGQAVPNDKGLTHANYAALVQTVFRSKYWDSTNVITFPGGVRTINAPGFVPPAGVTAYTQMESNFSLFFGLAVQAYESTLVSDMTRFDRFMEGDDTALNIDELSGLLAFIKTPVDAANPLFSGISQGACINCHKSALFSDATFPGMGAAGPIELDAAATIIDGTLRVGTELVLVDNGYYNIGVRSTAEDLGRGASVLGKPLSVSRQALLGFSFAPRLPATAPQNPRVAADGAFKVPGLRNVELTGPYFHNGCQLSLREVLAFYHRHGDFGDSNIANLDSPLADVKLDGRVNAAGQDLDTDQLIKFLLTLTDDRVRNEMAPFDHPQLIVPNGHPGDGTAIPAGQFDIINGVNQAKDSPLEIPAVGREGRLAAGLALLKPFLTNGALQTTPIALHTGWNTFSTPIKLSAIMDTWGEFAAHNALNYQNAYRWDGANFQVVDAAYVLTPLEAIYVQMNKQAITEIIPFEGVSAPPAKALTPGWNLVGAAFLDAQMPVKDAFSSAYFVPNNLPNTPALWGYNQIVSPSSNATEWAFVRDSLTVPSMVVGEGYWVNMVNAGQVSGFTTTPLQFIR